MKKTRRSSARKFPSQMVVSLGDLIYAAYEAADGFGRQRVERAAEILSASPLARRMSRHVEFVR
ncbi:MAG TPA: hypothetical protein VLV17_06750 [Anaeromyxobacteraceae bacterium]|nr:hypothetical protein [Anaeromyxobacteraceae bacterium]